MSAQIDAEKLLGRLFTARHVPLHYLVIPKCGCTYVKNLIWQLDHGASHTRPLRVHDDDSDFLRASEAGVTVETVRDRVAAFTVLRNPVDRFFSLYTDKVIGPGHRHYVPLRAHLVDHHGLDAEAASLDAHRRNCEILIDFLAANLKSPDAMENEAHWTPQNYRKNLFKAFNLRVLLLPDLTAQLRVLLRDVVPDLDALLKGLERNRSGAGLAKGQVLDRELRRRVNEVYGADRKLFNAARSAWEQLDLETAAPQDVPRYLDVIA